MYVLYIGFGWQCRGVVVHRFENGTCPVGHNAVVIAVLAVHLWVDKAAEVANTVGGFYSVLECTGWISQPEFGPGVDDPCG